MNGEKLKVIFDIDDTLNKLNEYIYRELGIIDKLSYTKRYELTHEMNTELTKDDIENIVHLWHNYDTFIKCPLDESIGEVTKLSLSDKYSVVLHSTCMNEAVAKAKDIVMQMYLDKSKVEYIFEIDCKNPLEESFAVVEDNLMYLINTNTKHRVLIDKSYNKAENYGITDEEYGITRVNSLKEAIERIKAWEQTI